MADKEIIKALECCLNTPVNCDNCAYTKYPVRDCNKILIKDITDLINRQQAEIDILKSELNDCERKNYDLENRIVYTEATIVKIRAEAIKGFAEKLKERYSQYSHLHKQADEAINDIRYPDFEMRSVWNVMDLCDSEIASYETMGDLQKNIEVIAKSSLLTEFEKDLDGVIKEMVG